ncbi:InlB B-repeat-containing protein [Aquabacterium sp.]|uniref:InlB B-repeat-containing protein n=1 Tax=Aquabacterium sp. TaxID=1872578 RepID=UPI002C2FBFCF|nr:hypothetical protein [Aquabacterium sp.]HSW03975.1 hypothetical protein [Aquabacterium sp.]
MNLYKSWAWRALLVCAVLSCNGMANANTVSASATPLPNHTLTVNATGSTTTTTTQSHAQGTAVSLSAAPTAGYQFMAWSGSCTGNSPTCTVTMSGARTVNARFGRALTVTVTGSGAVTSVPAGISCGSDCTEVFNHGTTITLTAAPAAGQAFSGWGGACSGTAPTCTVAMSTARNVTAAFAQSTWTKIADEGASFTVNGTQTVRFGAGSSWVQRSVTGSGQCTNAFFGSDPAWGVFKTCELLSGGASTTSYLLTTTVSGSGVVSSSPTGINCGTACSASFAAGSSVTLTATPAAGQTFTGWGGACSGSASCTVSMTAARTATATFAALSTGTAYYFSDCQAGAATGCLPGSNANPGTQAAPKRNLDGINVSTLPAGTSLLFARGGSWIVGWTRFENMNSSAAAPITVDAYGTGPAPLLTTSNNAIAPFELGGDYFNTSNDGGYVFRNLRLHGSNNSAWGFWFNGNVRDVVIENVDITGFQIGIHSQARAPHGVHNVLIRNSSISRNGSMGMLGQFSDTVIEGNLFEGNNYIDGSGFNHATYLSGHDGLSGYNVTLRNNRYIRNSVLNGVCQGGNMTFHGQMDGVLIEGNRIEQDAAAEGCWEMSITQGYGTAEWFRNFVVRNNKLINAGNTGMNAQSAPGIVVEGNVIINTQTTFQTGISVGHTEYASGDVPDGNAIVRNNTACYPTPHSGSTAVRVIAPNSQVSNNLMLTGAAATTGVCAR